MEHYRLDKLVCELFKITRKQAKSVISSGNVTVNGNVVKQVATHCFVSDEICLEGKRGVYQKYYYIMMNKPRGYLCSTTDDRGRKCVTDLLEGVDARVYPVGRLDLVSEGILLLTDDGELKNRLTHPKHTIGKVYRVKVAGKVSDEQMEILSSALVIDGYKIQPVSVVISDEDESGTVLKMTLFEGRNRQIRKMCEAADLTVKRLSRISIGNLKLDGLPVGKWRYLEQHEVDYLYKATKENGEHV